MVEIHCDNDVVTRDATGRKSWTPRKSSNYHFRDCYEASLSHHLGTRRSVKSGNRYNRELSTMVVRGMLRLPF